MSEDSSNNNTTEPINISPPSMETVEFLSYILGGESILNRDYRASPYNFVNNTNRPYIPMRRRRAVPSNIETYLDILVYVYRIVYADTCVYLLLEL